MDIEKYQDKEILMITPNEEKLNILDKFTNQNKLYNIKFMTIEEFQKNYFFDYDERAVSYLMDKYNFQIDVAGIYLKNLYLIDLEKTYHHSKLKKLKQIKEELLESNLICEYPYFKEYLKNKTIIVKNYPELELFLKNILDKYQTVYSTNEKKKITTKVKHFSTMEEEIVGTAIDIIKLINKGIPINKIFVANLEDDYFYLTKKIFSYFNIPINLKEKNSIYGTKTVLDFLKTGNIDLNNSSIVTKKLVDVLNSLVEIKDTNSYKEILKKKLKNTYLDNKSYNNAVNIVDIEKRSINDDEYVFLLGLNQDHFPKTYKDEDFITDNMKDEVELFLTKDKNIRKRESILRILSNIKNLSLSYKDESSFQEYYPSSLIEEESLEVVDINNEDFGYSNIYNKLILCEHLDLNRKYKTESKLLHTLLNHYQDIPYNTYDNKFTGINEKELLNYVRNPFTLSYTSMNSYNLCHFKYYIKNILKLDPFQDSFAALIGNLYHQLLSLMKEEYFNFEREWDKFLEDKELTVSEEFFLKQLKDELKELMKTINEQEEYTEFDKSYFEKKLNVIFERAIIINFTGTIDKLMTLKNVDDTYFSIVDYKTGGVDTSLLNMAYGINMQLPIYLYLVSRSNLFESPIFTGMYFQKILQPKPSFDNKRDVEFQKKDKLKLIGYSTDNKDILEKFDNNYENSLWIKGLKVKKDGDFTSTSKVLSADDVYNILKYTDKVINNSIDGILNADFSINPKIIDKKNLACKFCSYRDICFVKEKDYVYLDKKEDLSFLEVE